jgi:hypothetical protein
MEEKVPSSSPELKTDQEIKPSTPTLIQQHDGQYSVAFALVWTGDIASYPASTILCSPDSWYRQYTLLQRSPRISSQASKSPSERSVTRPQPQIQLKVRRPSTTQRYEQLLPPDKSRGSSASPPAAPAKDFPP